ncbi:MAG: hypothetical protein ACOY3V_05095 [Pseudomonadota bacterium]
MHKKSVGWKKRSLSSKRLPVDTRSRFIHPTMYVTVDRDMD